MELLAAGFVLWLLTRTGGQAEQPTATPPADEPTAGDVQQTLKDLAAVVPAAVAGGKVLLGAVTGGGTTAASTAGTTAAVAAGSAGAAAIVGPVTVALLANPIAWAIYVLIATIISKHQSESKNFDNAVWRLGANARALCNYERALWDEFSQNNRTAGAVYRSEVRDYRLDWVWNDTGSRVNLQGWRTILDFVPAPLRAGDTTAALTGEQLLTVYRRIRAAGLVYLQERATLGANIIRTRMSKEPPAGFGLDAFARAQLYERTEPGLGGLDSVPLLDGRTLERRQVSTDVAPPVAELVAVDAAPDFDGLDLGTLQAARIGALVDAVTCFRYDQLAWVDGHEKYAAALFGWIGRPAGVTQSGQYLRCDPARFGAAYSIDVRAAREGSSPVLRVL